MDIPIKIDRSLPRVIAIDFDGTCVTHEYPNLGRDIGAQAVLFELVARGHKLILFTMRSGPELEAAIAWFWQNKIELFHVQTNPTQRRWTTSPKCLADLYIDDRGLGMPLTLDEAEGRSFVDWKEVRRLLIEEGILDGTPPKR